MTELMYLEQAFLLAQKAKSKIIRPNPFVGAIVVCEKGKIVGEGYHQRSGEAHAEVLAINDALKNGADLSKATLYVTLEPCSHIGKTPPCTDLILKHKIPHVIVGSLDPNPQVSGIEHLEKNGVKITQILLPKIAEMNDVFNINQLNKRPKYILKTATTLNGKIADREGNSQWISNEKSRDFVHSHLRSNVDAILSTAKTVIKDNARLNIRNSNGLVNEVDLVIIDKELDLLKKENKALSILHKRSDSILYIVTNQENLPNVPDYIQFIQVGFNENLLDIEELHTALLSKNICYVLVEAGAKLNATMIQNKCIDELYAFICPSILTDVFSKNVFEIDNKQLLKEKMQLKIIEYKNFEEDLLIHYKVLY